MTEEAIRQLLVDCGFRATAGRGARWSVAGELAGGFEITVCCVSGRSGGTVLLVPSESARLWLLDMLAQNGAGPVDVRSEAMAPSERGRAALPLAVAGAAVAWFGWVLHSIAR